VRFATRNLLLALTFMASLSSAAQPITRISALASGQILVNGQPTSLAALDVALAEVKNQNGVVWYYRENARAEPPPEAMQAIQLVVKHRLPVSMSTKPDFSDVVDANGVSQLRKP